MICVPKPDVLVYELMSAHVNCLSCSCLHGTEGNAIHCSLIVWYAATAVGGVDTWPVQCYPTSNMHMQYALRSITIWLSVSGDLSWSQLRLHPNCLYAKCMYAKCLWWTAAQSVLPLRTPFYCRWLTTCNLEHHDTKKLVLLAFCHL